MSWWLASPCLLWMEEIQHQLIGSCFENLEGLSVNHRWCRISSINSKDDRPLTIKLLMVSLYKQVFPELGRHARTASGYKLLYL